MPDGPQRGTKTAYVKKIDALTKQVDHLEDQATRAVISQLRATLQQINAKILTAEGWRLQNLTNLQAQVKELMSIFEHEANAKLAGINQQSWELGVQSVDEPLKISGLQMPIARLSRNVVAVLQGFSADLIKNISQETLTAVNTTIAQSLLGQVSPFDAQKQISQIVGAKDNLRELTGISARAEKIFRTETGRVNSIATQARQDQIAEMYPDVMKRWLATGDHRTRSGHLDAHGQTVPVDGFFEVAAEKGGKKERLRFPRDPRGSPENTINCRCRAITWRVGYGEPTPKTTQRVDAEIERREA